MELNNNNRHMVDILFVLTLFFVFALSALTLVVLGANVYHSTVDQMTESFDNRTSIAYITQKIRQSDEAGALSITSFGDGDALVHTQVINDTVYHTYLYKYDDHMYELLSRADIEMEPSSGTAIIPLKDFKINHISSNLYSCDITTESGEDFSLTLSTHTKQQEGGQLE